MSRLFTIYLSLALIVVGFGLNGCKVKEGKQKQPDIAVANSYLQCVVKDLCGSETEILGLVPAGMCPGHFDISPYQVNQLCKCKLLLLFDFQKRIADSLLRIKEKGLKIYTVKAASGLCVPRSYISVAKETVEILSAEYPERKIQYDKKLKSIEKRLENLGDELLEKVEQSGLKKAGVLISKHQAQFADWLGLDVIATFSGRDTETAANINQCLQKAGDNTVRFVIANKQEGTELANAIAEHLGAKLVVFSNFPNADEGKNNLPKYDMLLSENVQKLLEATLKGSKFPRVEL